jgi:hypothetical protein
MRSFFTWFASIFQHGADDNHRCVVRCCHWSPASWVILYAYPTFTEKRCPPYTCCDALHSLQTSRKALGISDGVFPSQSFNFNVWLLVTAQDLAESVSSSISRLCFVEQGPCSLPIRAQCYLQKSGLQLSQNWKDCIIILAAQVQCAELLKYPVLSNGPIQHVYRLSL